MKKNIQKIVIAVFALAAALLVLRFLAGGEDTWICVDGEWVKHGRPAGPGPGGLCGDRARTSDFVQNGNVVKNKLGFKPDIWYLVYSETGGQTESAELIFDEESRCTGGFAGGPENEPCDLFWVISGYGAIVQGQKDGDSVLVNFALISPEGTKTSHIKLYFYNQTQDEILGGGQAACSVDAVLPVERQVVFSPTPIYDAVTLLLRGNLTDEEKQEGFSTEFPNPDFKLLDASLANGVLTLEFSEVSGFTSGGACRVGILAEQIKKTAMQFSGVREVRIVPESIFQP